MKRLLLAFRNVVNKPTKQRSFQQDPVFTLKFTVACKESCRPDEPLRIHHQLYFYLQVQISNFFRFNFLLA